MRTLKAVLILFLLVYSQAHAVTVWYQPTPYPLKKINGSTLPQDLEKVHVWDGWLNNSYNTTLVRDDKLQAGGWGDVYRSYLNWDLVGLPQNPTTVNLWLQFYTAGGTPTPFQFCILNSSWNTTVAWNSQPSVLGCTGMFTSPTSGGWAGWNITSWYQNWQSGVWGKYGMMINPQNNNNNFVAIRSSRYASDGVRPILQFDFTPTLELKMPLPAGYSWLLTNEIGGYECTGSEPSPDIYHQDNTGTGNHYSLDFAPTNRSNSGGASYNVNQIPILASASGKVVEATSNNGNGYYVRIDHDGDGDVNTGFQTVYLHMQPGSLAVSQGQTVISGQRLGFMGNTGISTGTHLHLGVRYKNQGYSYTSELTKVTLENRILKSYQTECILDSTGRPTTWGRYYPSN